jgi:hypothetical protein
MRPIVLHISILYIISTFFFIEIIILFFVPNIVKMECSVCKKPAAKRCSRCQAKYYCSTSCQKKDYPKHVVDCPSRSADILVRNVFDDKMPTNIAVLFEYGFGNCVYPGEDTNLLGLYIGLIKYIGCTASQLHSWWESGNLAEKVKKAYDDAHNNSFYYQWFLENDHVLQGLRKFEGEKSVKNLSSNFHDMIKSYLSEHDRNVPLESLPETKRILFAFYGTMLTQHIPRVEDINWIDFGFCSCKTGEIEEMRLCILYRNLIIQKDIKFDEFHDAYLSGTVMDLLKKYCNIEDYNWLSENKIEVYGYSQPAKSVYYLKQYVMSDSIELQPSVNVDYGFMNCRTKDEKRQLKNIYRKLIYKPRFDPRDLHKACLEGKIFDYVRFILPNETLKANLFKNPYPLKNI